MLHLAIACLIIPLLTISNHQWEGTRHSEGILRISLTLPIYLMYPQVVNQYSAGHVYASTMPQNRFSYYTQPSTPYSTIQSVRMSNLYNNNGLYSEFMGFVTPFVYWIDDYPLPDGLKMPSHIGTYDGNGDPDNYLHLFEGAIRMQKWVMHVGRRMFTYTLRDSTRIW